MCCSCVLAAYKSIQLIASLINVVRNSYSSRMHLYNQWLPGDLFAEAAQVEPRRFSAVVAAIEEALRIGKTRETLRWVSVANSFLDCKSELATEDVKRLATAALSIILQQKDDLFTQIRWSNVVAKVLRKYRKTLDIAVPWRPLYEAFVDNHLSRQRSVRGAALQQVHLGALSNLIRRARRYFPPGSAAEIWSLLRPSFKDLSDNVALEAAGLLSLFMPCLPPFGADDTWSLWLDEWLALWSRIPHCTYWDQQWITLFARCVKHLPVSSLDLSTGSPYSHGTREDDSAEWVAYLPILFTKFLSFFHLPVGKSMGASPSWGGMDMTKPIAKISILLLPQSFSQFEKLVEILEQYLHPSNGGSWTQTLEQFLRNLTFYFLKRLAYEKRGEWTEANGFRKPLEQAEQRRFVVCVMRLVDRAQFSKSGTLAGVAASVAAGLSYVAPASVVPSVLTNFRQALETVTATHQLEAAVTTLGLCTRSLLIFSSTSQHISSGNEEQTNAVVVASREALADAMYATIPGIDANDPPKTLATLRFFEAVFSNVDLPTLSISPHPACVLMISLIQQLGCVNLVEAVSNLLNANVGEQIGEIAEEHTVIPVDWSQWLEEFLSHVLSMLSHLEDSNNVSLSSGDNDMYATAGKISKGFLMQSSSPYRSTLGLLFSRLSPSLCHQALKKISKYVRTNIHLGAIAEIGVLCTSLVYANAAEAALEVAKPLMDMIQLELEGVPKTGRSNLSSMHGNFSANQDVSLSPSLVSAVYYHFSLLGACVVFGGKAWLPYKEQIVEVLNAGLDAPAPKIIEAASGVLSSILSTLVLYYDECGYRSAPPLPDTDGVEVWFGSKDYSFMGNQNDHSSSRVADKAQHNFADGMMTSLWEVPNWHIACKEELEFVSELLSRHLSGAIADIGVLLKTSPFNGHISLEKDAWRTTLLRLDSCLRGVRSCLPELVAEGGARAATETAAVSMSQVSSEEALTVAGSSGPSVGSAAIRREVVEILHQACKHFLDKRSDDAVNLNLLISNMDALVNIKSLEYTEWSLDKNSWIHDSRALTEPRASNISHSNGSSRRRPRWLVHEKAYLHLKWRASQAGYRLLCGSGASPPIASGVGVIAQDLLELSLHPYKAVRVSAKASLESLIKRFPPINDIVITGISKALMDPTSSDEAAQGACALLVTRPVMRKVSQDWQAMVVFIEAIMSSGHHETPKAQAAIGEAFFYFALRFAGVPNNTYQASKSSAPEMSTILQQLTNLSTGSMRDIHWRYSVMASAFLLLLSSGLSQYVGHFLKTLVSDLPPLRRVSIAALLGLLLDVKEGNKGLARQVAEEATSITINQADMTTTQVGSAVGEAMAAPAYAQALVSCMAVDHYLDAEDGVGRFIKGMAGRPGQMDSSAALGRVFSSMAPIPDWPVTKEWAHTSRGHGFSAANAFLFERLVARGGTSAVDALQKPIEDAVATVGDKGLQCVAAEAIAGILHAGTPTTSAAWLSWIRRLLETALWQCTVESLPEWVACIRFAATRVSSPHTSPSLSELTESLLVTLMKPYSNTSASGQLAKRLQLIGTLFVELPPVTNLQNDIELSAHSTLLTELLANMASPARQIRERVGQLIAMLAARLIQQQENPSQAPAMVNLAVKGMEEALKVQASGGKLSPASNAGGNLLAADGLNSAGISAMDVDSAEDSVRWLETMLYFVIASVKSGDAVFIVDTLISLLPVLLAIQETSDADLSLLAKQALAYLGYQPLPATCLHTATSVLLSATSAPLWHTRAAALSFIQPLTYRHSFLLAEADLLAIAERVVELLEDVQLEVRELAATTLSGLMKVADSDWVAQLRQRLVRTKQPPASSIVTYHGAILGLRACILSTPYDIPEWLPDLLMVMVNSVHEPNPIRSTVTSTIGEFKRTHNDMWSLHRTLFTNEQLEEKHSCVYVRRNSVVLTCFSHGKRLLLGEASKRLRRLFYQGRSEGITELVDELLALAADEMLAREKGMVLKRINHIVPVYEPLDTYDAILTARLVNNPQLKAFPRRFNDLLVYMARVNDGLALVILIINLKASTVFCLTTSTTKVE
eukprot:SM000207S06167  [mRNA]  locus=s207:23213:37436:- [translate_table: standard]